MDGSLINVEMLVLGANRLDAIPDSLRCVTILLSVYNGEKYLKSQLDSFLEQVGVNWRLCWRDDGSTDSSCSIMEEFAKAVGQERCVRSGSSGLHIGATASFLYLLAENRDSQFVAFADQDDLWLPTKLGRALSFLPRTSDVPALYCARQILTNENFTRSRLSLKFTGTPGFPASLTQNIATGGTIVLNDAAARLISAVPAPQTSNHDWWSYIIVSACGGRIIYDAVPSMLYRQHAQNLIGANIGTVKRAIAAVKRGPRRYIATMRRHTQRLHEYRHILDSASVADLQIIYDAFAGGIANRFKALRCPFFARAGAFETSIFRLWFLLYSDSKYIKKSEIPPPEPRFSPIVRRDALIKDCKPSGVTT